MATANTVMGILNGARQVEVTMNGVGERAGNTSLEEVVMTIKSHKHLGSQQASTHSLFTEQAACLHIDEYAGTAEQSYCGKECIAHSSGIHQDGVLKKRENYEIIDPVEVGVKESSIILTARSGRAALNHRLELLGYKFEKEELDEIYHRFLKLADKKKVINDEDIKILTGEVFQGEKALRLESSR
jgi:2-isopropylmalate synthase